MEFSPGGFWPFILHVPALCPLTNDTKEKGDFPSAGRQPAVRLKPIGVAPDDGDVVAPALPPSWKMGFSKALQGSLALCTVAELIHSLQRASW